MFNSYLKIPSFIFVAITFFSIFVICFYTPILYLNTENSFSNFYYSADFVWPVPSCSRITSYFGYRNRPTQGASSYHSGIDIGAPTGTEIVSMLSGIVSYTGFSGGGGFTVTINSGEFVISYCHVSPDFLVFKGQSIEKGQLIATVGPKNVYNVPNNPYKDSSGNPTNGATTGAHLHLTLKKDGIAVNPLDYVSIPN